MKQTILMLSAILGVGALIGLAVGLNRSKSYAVSAPAKVTDSNTGPVTENSPAVEPAPATQPVRSNRAAAVANPGVSRPAAAPAVADPSATKAALFSQHIDTLVSSQVSFGQKQAVWKELQESGQLDEAVTELEHRVAADPQSVEAASALGQAYYKKAGGTEDVRDRAIFAMRADQMLDTALKLDPANWESRFVKAVGMSYWPPELNKSKEVIDQFQSLIQQQESQTPQPQFARTYLRLGDEYKKAGNTESAMQIWQRGAALFPNSSELKSKLAEEQKQ
jgi:cytochrome c-type biogenesis protein CcmH/NrfG